jgi:hypothetical protein
MKQSDGELITESCGYITHGPEYEKVFITINENDTLKLEQQ